jgi:hypothetical protein
MNKIIEPKFNPTTSATTDSAVGTIVPSRNTVLENICLALIDEGISAKIEEDLIELESDDFLGVASLELLDDHSELSLTAHIFFPNPKDETARLKLLNGLNRFSGPVRFFQTCADDVIDACAHHLILGSGLNVTSLKQFLTRFIEEFAYAGNVLSEEGYFDDPVESFDGIEAQNSVNDGGNQK